MVYCWLTYCCAALLSSCCAMLSVTPLLFALVLRVNLLHLLLLHTVMSKAITSMYYGICLTPLTVWFDDIIRECWLVESRILAQNVLLMDSSMGTAVLRESFAEQKYNFQTKLLRSRQNAQI